MNKYTIPVALLAYLLFSLATLAAWHKKEINTVTGDEPHYLVIASGIAKYGSLEQTRPYQEEIEKRQIYKHGLAPAGEIPSPANTHTVAGPNGLFNIHNIGLPLLLVLPFALGGVIGAKVFMIACGALVILMGLKFSSLFSNNRPHHFWSVIAAAISLPLIPASNQIYPDVLAGLIALTGLYWFLTSHKSRTKTQESLLAIMLAFLPWLQIKFAAPQLLLILAISARICLDSKDYTRAMRILLISGISCIALGLYNHYAFGKFSGPYQSGALEISKTSFMVLLGLHFDQNQGLLFQNPINFIGILAIGWLYRFDRKFALVWGLVFLSLIVPNALHPNWYGGGSFSGRFEWAAAIVFIIPTIYGLTRIRESRSGLFRAVIAAGVILQLYLFYRYAVRSTHLYNKSADVWPDVYSIFFQPLHAWLPMLYNSNWAFGYAPNYAWAALILGLFFWGFTETKCSSKKYVLSGIFFFALITVSGLFKDQLPDEITFDASRLPSQTGTIAGPSRLADQSANDPGFINFGPYFPLRKGNYEVTLRYKSPADQSKTIGWFDVFDASAGEQARQTPAKGTGNASHELKLNFQVDERRPHLFEFRTYWNGLSSLEVQHIHLRKL